MTTGIVLDTHAHLIPIEEERLDNLYGILWDGEVMEIDGHRVGIKSIYKPDKLLEWMAREKVSHAWVSAPPPCYRQHLRGAEALEWCHYLNVTLNKIAVKTPDKLTDLPHLPIQDPAIACEIIDIWTLKGKRHFSMPTGTGDNRVLSDVEFEPLWQKLNETEAIIFFHPGSCADGRLQAFYLGNLLGNPHESAVAISHLLMGGVLERYPNIKPCFAHGGGTFPMLAGRMQRGCDTSRPGVNIDSLAVREVSSQIFVDCICHSEPALELAESTFGKENVLFGSDWPFPMGIIDTQAQMGNFNAERKARIFHENAQYFVDIDEDKSK